MNKDEILAKSRKENKDYDEREVQILANSSVVGIVVGIVVTGIMIIFSKVINEPLIELSASTVYLSMYGSGILYQFIQTKEKIRLFQATLVIILAFANFAKIIILRL